MLFLATLRHTPTWAFRALAHQLPDGLPAGALTVLRLPQQSVRRGPWSTLVGQLLLDTLDRCCPSVYTDAGEPSPAWPEAGINPLGPHYRGVSDICGCCPPHHSHAAGRSPLAPLRTTLDNLRAALADHERWHGPSLVIIDHVEHARPYADRTREALLAAGPSDGSTSADLARQWAADLQVFAASRPAAPTVVTVTAGPQGVLADALPSFARIVLTALPCERHRPVTVQVSTRPSLSTGWSQTTTVVLPWFDWGFDEGDLDAEDTQVVDADGDHPEQAQPSGSAASPTDPWAVPFPSQATV